MKLLFDENLSHTLSRRLSDLFPQSVHVRNINMKSADDQTIWDYAKENDFLIVSKDADMHDLSLLFGKPPKVVWIRLGNCSTKQVENLLRMEFDVIRIFYQDEYVSLLALP